jgi:hypothetical protein
MQEQTVVLDIDIDKQGSKKVTIESNRLLLVEDPKATPTDCIYCISQSGKTTRHLARSTLAGPLAQSVEPMCVGLGIWLCFHALNASLREDR